MLRKKDRNLFDGNEKKMIKDYMLFKNRNKLLLGLSIIPSLIFLVIMTILGIMENGPKLFPVKAALVVFFGGPFFIMFWLLLIDTIQATTREFIHEDKKGKLISLIIFATFLFKELFEIAHHHH